MTTKAHAGILERRLCLPWGVREVQTGDWVGLLILVLRALALLCPVLCGGTDLGFLSVCVTCFASCFCTSSVVTCEEGGWSGDLIYTVSDHSQEGPPLSLSRVWQSLNFSLFKHAAMDYKQLISPQFLLLENNY